MERDNIQIRYIDEKRVNFFISLGIKIYEGGREI